MFKRVTDIPSTWCPGCGNHAILGAIKQSLDQAKLKPHQTVFCYDVGCSSNMADFLFSYGFHGLHGRALPVSAGIKLVNPKLQVFNIIGDGGCYGEGIDHLIGLANGNHDLITLVHDNFLYSLTTGQKSPTTPSGTKTPSTPQGSIDQPFDPLTTALVNHATFVARGFSNNLNHLSDLIFQAINHTGFALIDILQPCPTFNKSRPIQWYQNNIEYLDKLNHNPADFQQAIAQAQRTDKLPIGLFYQVNRPAFHQQLKSVSSAIDSVDLSDVIKEYK